MSKPHDQHHPLTAIYLFIQVGTGRQPLAGTSEGPEVHWQIKVTLLDLVDLPSLTWTLCSLLVWLLANILTKLGSLQPHESNIPKVEARNLVTQPPLHLQHRHGTQMPLTRFTFRRLHLRERNLSKEVMPRSLCASKGGNGGVQPWGRSDSKSKLLAPKGGIAAAEVPWCLGGSSRGCRFPISLVLWYR